MGWRDSVSTSTQDDMDAVLDAALDLATEQLDSTGRLLPFAVALRRGSLEAISAAPGEEGDTMSFLAGLRQGLREQRAELSAAAIVADASVEGGDAVQVRIEHADRSAPALVTALPYRRAAGGVTYGELRAAQDSRQIWD